MRAGRSRLPRARPSREHVGLEGAENGDADTGGKYLPQKERDGVALCLPVVDIAPRFFIWAR